MTDKIIPPSNGTETGVGAKKPRSRKKLVAMIAACGLVLAGGITVVSVTAAKASAEETAQLCASALLDGGSASKEAAQAAADADKALEATKSTRLPKDAGTSTVYEKRPPVKAVQAAKDVKAVSARASGVELIGDVTTARTVLVGISIPVECTDRDQADSIQSAITESATATKTLITSVDALQDDFSIFQADESKRIAADQKAAEAKKQAADKAEKDRVAAENAESERAAAAEAARLAAEGAAAQPQWVDAPVYEAPAPVYQAPAPAPVYEAPAAPPAYEAPALPHVYEPPAPAPAPAPVGGGGGGLFVDDGSNTACWTSNGMGGTMPCP